jgi:hypothetical protein
MVAWIIIRPDGGYAPGVAAEGAAPPRPGASLARFAGMLDAPSGNP